MSYSHDHNQEDGESKRLFASLFLAASYMTAEVLGGIYTGSLALMADAGHMLSDVAALSLALGAIWIGKRPAPRKRTFGNLRVEVLAALANAIALGVVGIVVITEAVERWSSPPQVDAIPMVLISTGGLIVNVIALIILHGGQSESLNVRGALLHVLADALGSIGAIISGLLIWAFDWRWADPTASALIACLVLISSWVLLKQTLSVLMESAPKQLDVSSVEQALTKTSNVRGVHDLHVWTISGGKIALSAHLVVDDIGRWEATLEDVQRQIREAFDIKHVTVQPETDSGDSVCQCAFFMVDETSWPERQKLSVAS